MQCTQSNTYTKNESKHSEMGPVRQNPMQGGRWSLVEMFNCSTVPASQTDTRLTFDQANLAPVFADGLNVSVTG